MLVLKKNQINILDNFFLERFINSIKPQFKNYNSTQLEAIIFESKYYEIDSGELIIKYIEIYTENIHVFSNKPKWLKYILTNHDYLPQDKIDYLTKKLLIKNGQYSN